jgi:chemotaxis protein CheD
MQAPDHMDVVHLPPAQLIFCERPTLVTTVLGSCVSATLFDPKERLGAICHGVMPTRHLDRNNAVQPCGHYVDCAIQSLLEQFTLLGIPSRRLTVKLFGGSDMFANAQPQNGIGAKNIAAATDTLKQAGVPHHVTDLGGPLGRKILFFSDTGEVLLKRLYKVNWRAMQNNFLLFNKHFDAAQRHFCTPYTSHSRLACTTQI